MGGMEKSPQSYCKNSKEVKMKFFIPFLILFASCVNHEDVNESSETFPKSEIALEIEYAEGLEFNYSDDYTSIVSKSIEGNEVYRDSIVLVHTENLNSKIEKQLRSLPTSINCQSSTHLAYIDFFDQLNLVSGLCGLEFVQNGKIKDALVNNKTAEVCLGENIQLESVLQTEIDLFLAYPFAINQIEMLEESGVRTFMIAEYLETHPLARLEWIKFFGILFEQEEKANDFFNEVKNEYNALVQTEADTNKKFIFNLPYGESWFTPSANSLIVKLLEDAGLCYFYQEETGTENMIHAQEQVWSDGTIAPYWVIIADRPEDFTLKELIAENPVYGSFKSVEHQQVIFCNSRTSDYFLKGVIEPHVMLKDILFATHKIDRHQPKYFQLLK